MSHFKWNGCLQLDICNPRKASQLCSQAARITVHSSAGQWRERIIVIITYTFLGLHGWKSVQKRLSNIFNCSLLIKGCQKELLLTHTYSIKNIRSQGAYVNTGACTERNDKWFLFSMASVICLSHNKGVR